jgi:hypothetical protein
MLYYGASAYAEETHQPVETAIRLIREVLGQKG